MIAQIVPWAMAAILILATGWQIRTGRIPNWLTLLPFVLFVGVVITAEDWTQFYGQAGLAVGVFAAGLLLFFFAGFGAGAVKLMTGLALFVPLSAALYTFLIFIVAMFISSFAIIQLRKSIGSEQSKWHLMANAVLPMSVPICIAGLAALFWL
jgi:Flp pilus assembly protein protease CpaA